MLRWLYRWFTGLELDGVKRTDARWHTKGTDTRHGVREDDVLNWHYLPRGQRSMVRSGGTGLVVLLAGCAWFEPVQTFYVVCGLAAASFLVFVFWACAKLASSEVLQRWHEPLAVVLADRWHFTPPSDTTTWITVPDDSNVNADHPVEVVLPLNYRENQRAQEQSAKIIADRRGMKTHDFQIDYDSGPRPVMKVRAMEVPPDVVRFADVRDALDRSGDGHYFLGLGLRGAEVWIDLNGDSPHIAWSCGSGAGKSTAVRNVAAQVRREGGRIVILDATKEGDSHSDWIYDEDGHLLDGIEHHTDVESVHYALIALGEERSRRTRIAREAKRFRRPAPVFPRIMIVFEEQNGGYDLEQDYWKSIRKALKDAEGEEQPLQSPALTATKSLVYAGRSSYMNCFVSAQRFDAKILGGGDVRGNFMVRMLSRFDEGARRMLIPDILPKPTSSNHLGRTVVCTNGVATPVQGVLMEPHEAREWSSEGRPMIVEHRDELDVGHKEIIDVRAPDQPEQASDIGHRTPLQLVRPAAESVLEAPPQRQVSIKEALAEKIVTGTYEAVSRASLREGFPELQGHRGRDKLYLADELADWEERRARRSAMSR